MWPLSAGLLGEPVGVRSVVGAGALLAGLVLVGWQPGGNRRGHLSALLCAACIAGYHLFYKQAMALGASAPAVFALSLAVALPVMVVRRRVWSSAPAPRARAAFKGRVAAGVLCAASFIVFLVALADGGAGLVLTLRNTSVVFALLFARLLGEPSGPRQIAGSLAVAVGAAILGAAAR